MARRLLCLPFDIPSLYFPIVLYALFGLLSGYTVDSFFAMCIGYAYGKGYLDAIRPTSYYFENLESSGVWFRLSRNPGWVLAASSLGHDAYVAVNQVDRDGGNDRSGSSGGGSSHTGKKVFGFGDLPSASDEASESSAPTSFPGQGHKLAPSGGSSAGGGSFGAGLFGANPSTAASATTTISREELAAKRLAALGVQKQGTVVGTPVANPMNNV